VLTPGRYVGAEDVEAEDVEDEDVEDDGVLLVSKPGA